MENFIAIDFETANPKRVSACSVGLAYVENGEITNSKSFLIKPIGGHAEFQTKIHGITDEDTNDQPDFKQIVSEIKHIFSQPLVGHSLFDKQVLNALSNHFNLDLEFEYYDSSGLAKEKLPELKNHKLKTLVKHFDLPKFKHHDAEEDAIACANIMLKLCKSEGTVKMAKVPLEDFFEFKGLVMGILADGEVNYKEAYQLLYWLEDHVEFAQSHHDLYSKVEKVLDDDYLDDIEAIELKEYLENTLKNL